MKENKLRRKEAFEYLSMSRASYVHSVNQGYIVEDKVKTLGMWTIQRSKLDKLLEKSNNAYRVKDLVVALGYSTNRASFKALYRKVIFQNFRGWDMVSKDDLSNEDSKIMAML